MLTAEYEWVPLRRTVLLISPSKTNESPDILNVLLRVIILPLTLFVYKKKTVEVVIFRAK